MTKLVSGIVRLCVILFAASISFWSCTKTNTEIKTVTDTVTVVQKDTVVLQDTLLKSAVLTANSWKFQECIAQLANGRVYYVRGGSNNTQSFDNEYITFNTDHTGSLHPDDGSMSTFTWEFTNDTTINWVWNHPIYGNINMTWQHVRYKNGAIYYVETFIQNGAVATTYGIRIPK